MRPRPMWRIAMISGGPRSLSQSSARHFRAIGNNATLGMCPEPAPIEPGDLFEYPLPTWPLSKKGCGLSRFCRYTNQIAENPRFVPGWWALPAKGHSQKLSEVSAFQVVFAIMRKVARLAPRAAGAPAYSGEIRTCLIRR